MTRPNSDSAFAGSIPELYETYMVPMIFEPYAVDLSRRVAQRQPSDVLEIAAGTGVVTRHLAKTLAPTVSIVATDLNQLMLERAAAVGTARPIEWRQADAMQLPFSDQSFDVVVCEFGAMFFPDKAKAFAEARRVLRARGAFIFNVWDRIEENDFAHAVETAMASLFPADPPRFMGRIPHGYHDTSVIRDDLTRGGFSRTPEFTTITEPSRAASPRIPAVAFCQGTPLRGEIEARSPTMLAEATDVATAAIANRFGSAAVEGRMQAHVVTVER